MTMAITNPLEGASTKLDNCDLTNATLTNIKNFTRASVPFDTEMHAQSELEPQAKLSLFGFIQALWGGSAKGSKHVAASSIPDSGEKKADVSTEVESSELPGRSSGPEERVR